MSANWTVVSLSDIVNFKTGRLDSNAAEEGGIYPFFTCSPTTLAINSYAFDDEAILLAGNNANGLFAVKYFKGKFNAYQRTYVITPIDKRRVSVQWLYFRIKHVTAELQQMSVGTATKFLTKKILDAYEVSLPSYDEQERIADILWSLQDKLNLNTQTNQTLEAIAQAIFKSWFVDFEPVKAKMAVLEAGETVDEAERAAMCAISGKDEAALTRLQTEQPNAYAELAQTAALFPSAMQDSELGEIPKGWMVSDLKSCATEIRRGISPKYTEDEGIQVVNQKCIRNHSVDFSQTRLNDPTKKKVNGREIVLGDVLVNSTGVGTLGRLAPVRYLSEPAVVDSHVTVVRANTDQISKSFLAGLMFVNEAYIESSGAGSTGQTELRKEVIEEIRFAKPNLSLSNVYESIAHPISSQIAELEQQKLTLSVVRDSLLPKLLSGELTLPPAEKTVSEADSV